MKWLKQNGTPVETNDLPASIERAKELGWVQEGDNKTTAKAKAEAEAKAKKALLGE